MRYNTLALLSAAGLAAAQGVYDKIAPTAPAPAGCSAAYDGKFEFAVLDVKNGKRDVALKDKRAACSGDGILVASLSGGQIKDAKDRTGYIAANYQFQFDGPPQTGAIYTAGFSICGNGSLALGGSAVWYKCQSGDFFNLYDRWWAAQCSPVEIAVMPCGATDPVNQSPDGQIVGTSVIVTTVVVPLSDGQPQVITTKIPVPLCQITDGQLQLHTTPCASVPPATVPTAAPVSQYSDGQIQVTTGKPAPSSSAYVPPPATVTTVVSITTPSTTPKITSTITSAPSAGIPGGPIKNSTLSTTHTVPPPATIGANGAGRLELGSAAALALGLLGAALAL